MTDPVSGGATPEAGATRATTGAAARIVGLDASGRPWPAFAHGSEAEMARILDFYEVRWEYEPRTFPILWSLEGEVVESFSPDFYLPELDLFLEMTTLRQRLVRKKNRKLRRLRELYPDIRIKLFYARDFRAMLLKYGRQALAESLSGTLGQVAPDRGRAPDVPPEVAPAAADRMPEPREIAAPGPGLGPVVVARREAVAGSGRNASRSRRRRAAAAARAAARAVDSVTLAGTAGRDEEARRPR